MMRIAATIGDGDFYFFVSCMFYLFGNPVDFLYLAISFLVCLHWNNTLKPLLHHSRPYYDDLSLGEEPEMGGCSGEFGSPSSHSLLAAQFIPTFLLFMRGKKLLESSLIRYSVYLVSIPLMLMIFVCRFYLGRHSLDQIIFGAGLGFVTAHFLHYFVKPRLFDPFFYKEHPLNQTIT